MVREDIIGMVKTALQRGKNIQQTVQSLYNSGYQKNEVDEAVQAVNTYAFPQPVRPQVFPQKPIPLPKQPVQRGQTEQIVSSYPYPQFQQPFPQFYQPQQFFPQQFQQFPQFPQIVSDYGQNAKSQKGKIVIMVMVAMLVVLLGILVAVFLFKDELTSFINNL